MQREHQIQDIPPNVEIKDYNIKFDGRNFFDQSIIGNIKAYQNILKIARRWLHNWFFIRLS